MASPRLKPRSDLGQHHLGKFMGEGQLPHPMDGKAPTPSAKPMAPMKPAPSGAFGKKAAAPPFDPGQGSF